MSGSNLVTTETILAQNAEVIRSARPLEGHPVTVLSTASRGGNERSR